MARKLWSVHLNDQNGLKYDQDKTFGSVDLRRAFNTVWVLERGRLRRLHRPGRQGDAHDAGRPTRRKHLANSKAMFLRLLDVVRSVDDAKVEAFRAERDYEGLEMYILGYLTWDEPWAAFGESARSKAPRFGSRIRPILTMASTQDILGSWQSKALFLA